MIAQPDLWSPVEAQHVALKGKHAREIQELIPVARRLAREAGREGITVGNIRLAAGLHTGTTRALSFLVAVPRAAGLVNTRRRRMSPLPGTRNDNDVWVLPEYSEEKSS